MRTAHAVLAYDTSAYFPARRSSALIRYLLTLMTPEQQMELGKAHPLYVLLCFLDWPWQDLFFETAGLMWSFLPPSSYGNMLRELAYCFREGYWYFLTSFRKFFMQSPQSFKKYFVESETDEISSCDFLSIFSVYEDSECIEIIFRNVDAADRVKLVFHRNVLRLFYKCILRDRWHMVEVCLREATLWKGDRERLKEAFMGFLKRNHAGQIEWENPKWKRFFEFLDETDASPDEEKKGQK
ncbi:hypothetical protein AVEN_48729-1 [Araneus ventricosus]|uniref:Uncharacterized protein n=1 Tax=Araneus ventricosus TaxID=182803 RepID=A0A4Y2T3J1_ARAVE|nr:hypothetical protein AVEN_48729-1 [Araneus ventricosus]